MNPNDHRVWLNLEKYKGKWVAFDENEEEIIASSQKAKTAYERAVKKGIKVPILFKVPGVFAPYIGTV